MADAHANFAYSLVATAPSPASSGTSLVVTAGQGALFPTVPFNATIWPTATFPTSTNAEIVRVTARSTDTLTITRAQEGTGARTVVVGDQIAATATAKTFTDIENVVPPGTIVDYVEFNTDVAISATTEATANTIVTGNGFTPNGTDSFWIEFFCPGVQPASVAAAGIEIVLYDNGSGINPGSSMITQIVTPSAAAMVAPAIGRRRVTPTNAAHTYSIRAYRSGGNGSVRGTAGGTSLPGYISITKAS